MHRPAAFGCRNIYYAFCRADHVFTELHVHGRVANFGSVAVGKSGAVHPLCPVSDRDWVRYFIARDRICSLHVLRRRVAIDHPVYRFRRPVAGHGVPAVVFAALPGAVRARNRCFSGGGNAGNGSEPCRVSSDARNETQSPTRGPYKKYFQGSRLPHRRLRQGYGKELRTDPRGRIRMGDPGQEEASHPLCDMPVS